VAIQTCPTDIVAAPPERIWKLLTDPRELAAWTGTRLIDGPIQGTPTRALAPGDRIILSPGFGMRLILDVLAIEPLRRLTLDARLPFGVVNHERFEISPAGARGCRVTFN